MKIISCNDTKGLLLLRCDGRIDTLASASLEMALEQAASQTRRLHIDLQNVDFISSAGLRILLHAAKSMASADGEFFIVNPSDHVMKIFRMAGFDQIFKIIQDSNDKADRSNVDPPSAIPTDPEAP